MKRSIYLGWDARETDAYDVAVASLHAQSLVCPKITPVIAEPLRERGLYTRKETFKRGLRWDKISDAPMSTEHAITRFLTPLLAKTGLALFMDADVLVRRDIGKLFALADPQYAVQVVKHRHVGRDGAAIGADVKMDGQHQDSYPMKNWSSVVLWNVEHPANQALTLEMVNTVPGRDLHRFCWLEPEQIGALPATWNHLVGIDAPNPEATIAHFTMGIPSMRGYANCEFAGEWRSYL